MISTIVHCPISANDVDQRPATLTCVICGAEFTAKRESAKCCSGTRVANVAARLAKADAALHEASVALGELRALVEIGVGKVAP